MPVTSASPSLLLCRSLSVQLISVFHEVRFIAFLLYGMRLPVSYLMYFILPINVCIKIDCHTFCTLRLFYILLLVFQKFLEPNRHFTFKMDSDVSDGVIVLN